MKRFPIPAFLAKRSTGNSLLALLTIGSVLLTSCGRNTVAQNSSHDDLYYDSAADVADMANADEYAPYTEDAAVNTQSYDWYAGDDQYLGSERMMGDADGGLAPGELGSTETFTDADGNTVINNTYYGDVYDGGTGMGADPFFYSNRARMLYQPTFGVGFGTSFLNPWNDPFYNPWNDPFYNPWGWNRGLTVNVGFGWGNSWGWNRWNRPWGWNAGWNNPWNNPWAWNAGWGWNNPWNNPWCYGAGYGNGWGWNNGWNNGWGNPYGWNTAYYYDNGGSTNTYYGPRGSTSTNATTDPRDGYLSSMGSDRTGRNGLVDENGVSVPRNPVSSGSKDRTSPSVADAQLGDRTRGNGNVVRDNGAAASSSTPVNSTAAKPSRDAVRNPVFGSDRSPAAASSSGPKTVVRDRNGVRTEIPAGTQPALANTPRSNPTRNNATAASPNRNAVRPIERPAPANPAYAGPSTSRSLEPKGTVRGNSGRTRSSAAPSRTAPSRTSPANAAPSRSTSPTRTAPSNSTPSRSNNWFNGGNRSRSVTPSRSSSPSRTTPSRSTPSRSTSPSRSSSPSRSGGVRSTSPSRSSGTRSSGSRTRSSSSSRSSGVRSSGSSRSSSSRSSSSRSRSGRP